MDWVISLKKNSWHKIVSFQEALHWANYEVSALLIEWFSMAILNEKNGMWNFFLDKQLLPMII